MTELENDGLPPAWLIKTVFVVFLPFAAMCILASIVASQTASALRMIYLEIRVEIASAREQWGSIK